MKAAARLGAFLLTMASLTACVTAQSVSVSQIPASKHRKNVVTAEDSRVIILFIPFGTGHVEEARSELLAKCRSGSIEGLTVKHENTRYLAALFMKDSVTMSGYCVAR